MNPVPDRRMMHGMKTLICAGLIVVALTQLTLVTGAAEPASSGKIRVLVVTGGHAFDEAPFWQMFEDNKEIVVQRAQHPNAHAHLKPEAAKAWDVIVLYDMWQPITDEAKADFLNLLKAGKGIVALHHSLASYQDWPDYARIIGGKYVLEPTQKGAPTPPLLSTFKHGAHMTIRVANRVHPVTRGMQDFEILDEAYGSFLVADDVIPLLTAEHPASGPVVGWARTQEKSRIVCLQGGHDGHAYGDPNYRRLLANAIRWTAGRD